MVYLERGNYCGLEPDRSLLTAGLEEECPWYAYYRPQFFYSYDFEIGNVPPFNYILAHSIITHTTPKQIRQCFNLAKRNLLGDGKFLFTFNPGSNTDSHHWVYPGYVTQTWQRISRVLGECGLTGRVLPIRHPGNKQKWVVATHK